MFSEIKWMGKHLQLLFGNIACNWNWECMEHSDKWQK